VKGKKKGMKTKKEGKTGPELPTDGHAWPPIQRHNSDNQWGENCKGLKKKKKGVESGL